jgi:hypothetical protein
MGKLPKQRASPGPLFPGANLQRSDTIHPSNNPRVQCGAVHACDALAGLLDRVHRGSHFNRAQAGWRRSSSSLMSLRTKAAAWLIEQGHDLALARIRPFRRRPFRQSRHCRPARDET